MATLAPPGLDSVRPTHPLALEDRPSVGGAKSDTSPSALFACLDQAVATSNAALVRIRDALREVERASRAYVEGLRANVVEIAGADSASMEANFRKLDTAVADYLRRIETEAKVQNELASAAAGHCDAILAAAHRIARVAVLARILSLNAAAKAAQISNSAALEVIVQQLTRLSTETRELAKGAIAAGDQLVSILPALAGLTDRLLTEATTFACNFRESFQALSPAAASLQRQLGENLADSDRRLRDLVALSRKAFLALRFEAEFIDAITEARHATATMVTLADEPQIR